MLQLDKLTAIDIHTHADGPCGTQTYEDKRELSEGMQKYFKRSYEPEPISQIAQYYRERKIGLVIFTVDSEHYMGHTRYSNEEVARQAAENSDIMIPFASIDPWKGKQGAREARRLVRDFGVQGFKFHPSTQGFYPNDRMAYPLYEAIAESGKPALFHTGQTGVGSGMPGGYGIRLKYSNPMYLDDVAVDFPDMKIILAHPSWPWVDESLSMALHKDNVFIDLSGWSPKYFPKQVIQYANTQLKHKMMFGSDFPLIHPDKWIAAAQEVGFREEVMPGILKDNAARVLGLT